MYLIAAWAFPAHGELTRDRVAQVLERRLPEAGIVHLWLGERDGWRVIGMFLDGSPADDPEHTVVERVRQAIASVVGSDPTIVLAEIVPLPSAVAGSL
ncbi:hypothetical protein ACWT_6053 [Actinoplanes sp. SE50]|uniref:hypothetical protein n=1 Tax=unclassified Actinoplanes TaxID=2626549 RepID=UPI00023EC868|nr:MULTISPECIES: hypothetical protein [unclassified Actinoplanes]AEV87070.1 hypothetical protein ACPL_6185 [Actinoplanes sp. SE50/110]ATO85468.1 hypothetical protein ACWT_6053 [Actinoplanes sp. SE50]SLM02880.1 hypothetical protein ACSP50_6165 [Actinoplanes sp. SE50/110]